jgi:hypothetical protein
MHILERSIEVGPPVSLGLRSVTCRTKCPHDYMHCLVACVCVSQCVNCQGPGGTYSHQLCALLAVTDTVNLTIHNRMLGVALTNHRELATVRRRLQHLPLPNLHGGRLVDPIRMLYMAGTTRACYHQPLNLVPWLDYHSLLIQAHWCNKAALQSHRSCLPTCIY